MRFTLGLLGVFAATSVMAAPPPVLELSRTEKWNVHYDDDSCILTTKFGENDEAIFLRLTRYGPGDAFNLRLLGNSLKRSESKDSMQAGFGENMTLLKRFAMLGTAGTVPMIDLGTARLDNFVRQPKDETEPPAITPEQEGATTAFWFSPTKKKILKLKLVSMKAPMQAMRRCTDNLVKEWGFDPAQQASLSRPARPLSSPGSWLRSGDYPYEQMREGNQAMVFFRLTIDPTGTVKECFIQHRTMTESKDQNLDTLTCTLIKQRAKFSPALDKDGNPVSTYFTNTARWMIGW